MWVCRALSGWYVQIYVDTYHVPPNDISLVFAGPCIRFGLEGPGRALFPLQDVTSFVTSSDDDTFHPFREGLCHPFPVLQGGLCPTWALIGGAGTDLSHADLGRLVQKVKALQLGFQPAQIRAVLLADSKALNFQGS